MMAKAKGPELGQSLSCETRGGERDKGGVFSCAATPPEYNSYQITRPGL